MAPKRRVQREWAVIVQEMSQRGFTPEQIAHVQPHIEDSSAPGYESPEHTTNIYIDEVCIKKQKPHRKLVVPSAEQQLDEELKRVHTSVARIEHHGKGFTLVGPSLFTLLRLAHRGEIYPDFQPSSLISIAQVEIFFKTSQNSSKVGHVHYY